MYAVTLITAVPPDEFGLFLRTLINQSSARNRQDGRRFYVKDVMSKALFCCNCTERKLLGIITDRDICIKAVATGRLTGAMEVSEVMSKATVTCGPDESLEACEARMERNQIRRVPVVDAKDTCIGIVAQADVARHDTAEHTYHTVAAISQHRTQSQAAARA